MLFRGFSFGGFVAIILAMSPFVSGNGAVGPLAIGGGGGGGGGGGMLHGGEMGLGGVGSGVGGAAEGPGVPVRFVHAQLARIVQQRRCRALARQRTVRPTIVPVQQVRRYGA